MIQSAIAILWIFLIGIYSVWMLLLTRRQKKRLTAGSSEIDIYVVLKHKETDELLADFHIFASADYKKRQMHAITETTGSQFATVFDGMPQSVDLEAGQEFQCRLEINT